MKHPKLLALAGVCAIGLTAGLLWATNASAQTPAATGTDLRLYPAQGVRLQPLTGTGRGLVARGSAELATGRDLARPPDSLMAGAPMVRLYDYSNDVAGDIQPNGSLVLTYQHVPVWVATWQLKGRWNALNGPYRQGAAPASGPDQRCEFVSIVDARTGEGIEAFEDCH